MNFFLFALALCFLSFGCSDDNTTSAPQAILEEDNYKPPYTVRYEARFSTNQLYYSNGNTKMYYSYEVDGEWRYYTTYQQGLDYLSTSELNGGWSRTFLVTVGNNPNRLEFYTNFNPAINAIAYFKIYVNNVLVKESAENVSPDTDPLAEYRHGIMFDLY